MLLRDYLELNADFYSPPPNSSQCSTSAVSDVEVESLDDWKPTMARRDPRLVDSLIDVLNNRIGNTLISDELLGDFESIKRIGRRSWEKNEGEADASNMVRGGALAMAQTCSEFVGCPFSLSPQCKAPNVQSKVDYLFHDDMNHNIAVEIKAPNVFSIAEEAFFSGTSAFRLDWNAPNASTAQKVLCLYMGAHRAQWGVLTCHDKWLFVRLHVRTGQKTYITFSTVERQASNTRPFRALLGMMLAAKEDIHVESNADLGVQLPKIVEEELPRTPSPRSSGGQSGNSYNPADEGLSEESSQGERSDPPVLRQRPMARSTPDIFLAWSRDVTSSNEWLSLYSVYGADGYPSIDCKPARLRLQREIGAGSTACVYEAKPDHFRQNSQTYAIKVVTKGTSEDSKRRIAGLYREFKIYRMIEKARSEGRFIDMSPRCYGLYETVFTISLVMEYVGESLDGIEWDDLSQSERSMLYNTIWDLHAIGIYHHDLAPRNVVRNIDGTFKIIDFESSTLHRCPGVRPVSQLSRVKGRDKCQELDSMWRLLGKPDHGPKWHGPFENRTGVRTG